MLTHAETNPILQITLLSTNMAFVVIVFVELVIYFLYVKILAKHLLMHLIIYSILLKLQHSLFILGLSGTGKSSLCHIVQKELTVWSHMIQCRSLRGRKDIPESLGAAILSCQEHSPAVLICDDIDSLLPPNMEGLSTQDIAYYQR